MYIPPPGGEPATPALTADSPELAAMILTAARTVDLPATQIEIEPGDTTLVNFDTIFHTDGQPVQRTVDILGFSVELDATPSAYTWHHGDGTQQTTRSAGRAYPAKDITHRYRTTGSDLSPRVDVTYSVRYRVDGGDWQDLGTQLVAAGPTSDLNVREATPHLAR